MDRPYWRCYFANTDGIIFVVDSADVDRTMTAKNELTAMLQEDELRAAPLLVLANKQVDRCFRARIDGFRTCREP